MRNFLMSLLTAMNRQYYKIKFRKIPKLRPPDAKFFEFSVRKSPAYAGGFCF